MTKVYSQSFGKAQLSIEVEGCISCGTGYSSGWEVAKQISVTIGKKTVDVPIYRCADCKPKPPKIEQLTVGTATAKLYPKHETKPVQSETIQPKPETEVKQLSLVF